MQFFKSALEMELADYRSANDLKAACLAEAQKWEALGFSDDDEIRHAVWRSVPVFMEWEFTDAMLKGGQSHDGPPFSRCRDDITN